MQEKELTPISTDTDFHRKRTDTDFHPEKELTPISTPKKKN
jgi:hypothetical protein